MNGKTVTYIGLGFLGLCLLLKSNLSSIFTPPNSDPNNNIPDNGDVGIPPFIYDPDNPSEAPLDDWYQDIPIDVVTASLGVHGGLGSEGLLHNLSYVASYLDAEVYDSWLRGYGGATDGYYLLPSTWTAVTEYYFANGGKPLTLDIPEGYQFAMYTGDLDSLNLTRTILANLGYTWNEVNINDCLWIKTW